MSHRLEFLHLLKGSDLPLLVGVNSVPANLEHRQRVEGNVRAGPGVGSGGKVVGVRLAGYLEDRRGDLRGDGRLGEEPFGFCPGLHYGSRSGASS